MAIFLFLGSRRGYAVLKKLIAEKSNIVGILCLIEDPHEPQYHLKISALAQEHSILIFYTTDIKPSQYADLLEKIKPDIAFAIGWRYLINKAAYRIPTKGTLIIHDSLLPKYRGFAPMNWAIINGEKETGVTLFYIAEDVDCGPIVDQLSTHIDMTDTAQTVDERIIQLYEEIIIKNLAKLASGKADAVAQDEAQASYTCKRTPKDGEINWKNSAIEIYNLIRGLTHPFPGAYTVLNGKKITIWQAKLPAHPVHYVGNIPGRMVGKKNGMIEVLTGDGVLYLERLQCEGEEETNAGEMGISVKDTFGWG